MQVLVTGGAGFIGANLCRHLARDHRVVVLDDLSTGEVDNLSGCDVHFVKGSILDGKTLDRVLEKTGAVVHLAARPSVPRSLQDPLASHDVNATGTLELLEAVRRAGGEAHVILASSSSVYGVNPKLPRAETDMPMPVSPYAVSKLATEQYALAYAASFGMDVLPFRFFNVFGPLQRAGHAYAAVVPAFVEAALAGRPLIVFGDGQQTRDFTFIDSLCAVITDAVDRRVSTRSPVNLAFGSRTSLLDLVHRLERILERRLEVDHQPPRPGDVRDSQADQSLLRSLFPSIEALDLDRGLLLTAEWFGGLR